MLLLQPRRATGATASAGGMVVLVNVPVIIHEKLMRKLLTQGQTEAVGTKINISH